MPTTTRATARFQFDRFKLMHFNQTLKREEDLLLRFSLCTRGAYRDNERYLEIVKMGRNNYYIGSASIKFGLTTCLLHLFHQAKYLQLLKSQN